jgi:hypothetical protein
MAILPIRDLGSAGTVTDVSPYNLPLNAFSRSVNIRFDEGKARRSPIFRSMLPNLAFTPRFCFGIVPSTGFDTVVVASDDYQLHEYVSGSMNNRSGTISSNVDPRPFTSTQLANVAYVNRPDKVPSFRGPGGTNFAALNNWPSNYRCESLRSFGDVLIALNTSEGATSYPTRVRFSDITLSNTVPTTWDESDTTASAGFNDLVQMDTPIVDGGTLGSNFIIYSSTQVWLMEFTGGTFLYNFRKLYTDCGMINQNCFTEVDGKHFVFGPRDIYVHDATSKQSICDERVKQFIYQGLNASKADRCFVHHSSELNLIYFCYVSGDELVGFPNTDRCNRAAVYNYKNNTWSFADLPDVASASLANVNTVETYGTASGLTYNTVGGSYYDQEDSFARHSVFVGPSSSANGITSNKIYVMDLADNGQVSFSYDTEANKPAMLERVGIDLDEAQNELRGYKNISRIYPQAMTKNTDDTTLSFQFGAADVPNGTPNYDNAVTFDLNLDYKIDTRAAGRYLSYKITVADQKDFEFSGFDLEVTATGRR